MTTRRWILAALVTGLMLRAADAADYKKILTLAEPLGHTWTEEVVHQDLEIREARVAADTLALHAPDGTPVAVQVEVLDGKPEAVRKVRLWFKATLPGDEVVAYEVACNDEGRKAAQPDGGAGIRREGDLLVLSSGETDLVLSAPAKPFDKPRPLKEVPPIVAARPAVTRDACGQWRIEGSARVRSITATVEAAGPVWARVRLKYAFEDGGQIYEAAFKAVAGEPWIDVQETYRLPPETHETFVLGEAFKPVRVYWLPWFSAKGGDLVPDYDLKRLAPASLFRDGRPFATLRPKWAPMRDTGQVCLVLGFGEGSPAVGAAAVCPSEWQKPYDQFITVRAGRAGREVALDFPLAEGQRHWALVAGAGAALDSKARLQRLIRARADLPLDRVLGEWQLRWKRDPDKVAPHLETTWKRLGDLRAALAAEDASPAAALVRRVLAGEVKGDKKLAEFLADKRPDLASPPIGALAYVERCYQDEALSPPAYPRRLRAILPLADLEAAGRPAGDAQLALLGYVFSDPNYWAGYGGGWDVANPAYLADMYAPLIQVAAMIPDHPSASRWMELGSKGLKDDLRRIVMRAGGGPGFEPPGDSIEALGTMLPLMRAIQNSGLGDPFRWPETRAALEYLRGLHTPPDPRLGRRSLVPTGDMRPWQDDAGTLFGMAAAGLKRSDPAFAAHCMALYRHYYGDDGSGDLARDVLLADPSVPEGRLEDPPWPSRAFPGFGAVLRSRFGAPDEAFAGFKCGAARGHYQGDELSFHFFGAGMPIALDWHSGRQARPEQEHMHNRVNLGDNENMDAVGEMLAFRASEAGDLAVGQVRSDHLRKMPLYPQEIAGTASYPRRTLAAEARLRRYLLLVKHPLGSPLEDYLVIRDEAVSAEPATFNLFVLARSVRQDGRLLLFDGQLAADAIAYVATPRPDKVRLDRWAWPKQDESSLIPRDFEIGRDRWRTGELQQWVRIPGPPGEPMLVVLYAYRKGLTVPAMESLAGGKGVRVTLGDATEDVYLATDPAPEAGGQAVVRRDGQTTVILKAKDVKPL